MTGHFDSRNWLLAEPTAPRYEIKRSPIGRRRWRVRLIGANGEPLSVSEHLTSRAACLVNIAAQRGCVDAPMVEA